jgi:RND family efflux transporter MFP subunit
VVRPTLRPLSRDVVQPGQIEALAQTPVYAKVAGFVESFRVDIGDRVYGPRPRQGLLPAWKGQVLARLTMPELEAELASKQSLIAQAQAEATQATEALHLAQAGLSRADAEVKRWASQLDRDREMASRKVINKQELDESEYQLAAVKAARDESEARVRKARADVTAAAAHQAVAEAERRRVAALLEYAVIRAPFDGVVSARATDLGHFHQPGASGPKGEPLFVITRTDVVRVFVEVPEADAAWVKDGQQATVRVQALRDRAFAGTVARSTWALDPRSRTLRTAIDLPNPDGQLRPGMYAHARIVVEHPPTLTLPAAAVVAQGDAAYCMRVVEGRAVRTPLRIGLRGGGLVEVLQRQDKGGSWVSCDGSEEVAAENPADLKDGQEVNVAGR